MKRSTIIATCLINSNFSRDLREAELRVRQIFEGEYPHASFSHWNQEVNDDAAENIVKAVGRASTINVLNFIRDLSEA